LGQHAGEDVVELLACIAGAGMNKIEFGDCRELMRDWPSGIADACITDPPYGDTSLNWDRRVDGWMDHVARVLKPAASVWVFGSMRYLVTVFADMERHGFRYGQDVVWEKQNGTGFHADRFRRVHEHAVMFYRGRWRDVYHAPQYTLDATAKTVRRKTRPTHTGRIDVGHYVSHDGGPRLVRSVLRVRNEHGRAVHPTQKPEELVERLVAYSVPPGGLVIDPFMGSGTTAVVALQHGRQYLGCELNPEYGPLQDARITAKEMANV
jgi:site-specific DNA-methyltransferase (adenine-specific)